MKSLFGSSVMEEDANQVGKGVRARLHRYIASLLPISHSSADSRGIGVHQYLMILIIFALILTRTYRPRLNTINSLPR